MSGKSTIDELPGGWAETALEDIARDVTYGYTAKSNRISGGAKMLRITDIQDNRVDWSQVPFCAISATDREKYLLKKWDLVFARTGATVGKSFLIQDDVTDSVFASYLIRVRCLEQEMAGYLSYFFNSPAYWDQITDFSAGIGQPNVNGTKLKGLSIPLAPLAEQKRIADKLEAVLGRVDACRARLDRVPALLKRFRQSVLAAATSGKLTEEWRMTNGLNDEWQKKKLTDLGELGRGKSKHRPRGDNRLYNGPYPFVQTGDVANSRGSITEHSKTYSEFGLSQSKLWPKGTVCITIAANIADTAILTYPACFPDSVVGFVADPEVCVPQFIKWIVEVAKEDLEAFAPATAQKNINLGILYKIEFGCPEFLEQQEIVRRVEALFAFADRIEARLATAQKTVGRLTPATLAKAFRGELVPQDPNDEPASALLARLREQKAAVTSTKPKRACKTKAARKQTQKKAQS